MCELSAAKRRAERLEAKIRLIKELIEIAEGDKKELIEVRGRVSSNTPSRVSPLPPG